MRPRLPVVIAVGLTAIVVATLYVAYRLIDPLPPRRFPSQLVLRATPYDSFARQYAAILARHGVKLEIRNTVSTVDNLDLLRSASSGVQAALMTFGFTQSNDADTLYSLGGIYDAPIFVFYKSAEPITQFGQFRGKRLSITGYVTVEGTGRIARTAPAITARPCRCCMSRATTWTRSRWKTLLCRFSLRNSACGSLRHVSLITNQGVRKAVHSRGYNVARSRDELGRARRKPGTSPAPKPPAR